MTRYAPTFNGIDLSEYLEVTSDFQRGIGTDRINRLLQVGTSDFSKYNGYRLGSKAIRMPFKMRYDLLEKRRELASILDVTTPARLVFPDEPHLYYLAIPEGLVGLAENNFLGTGAINWIVPDGVAHSVNDFEVTNQTTQSFTSNYSQKVVGSTVENPHRAYRGNYTAIQKPSVFTIELTQAYYDQIKSLDNVLFATAGGGNGQLAQTVFAFDIVKDIEQRLPEYFSTFGASTLSEKVNVLRKTMSNFSYNIHGYGTAPSLTALTTSPYLGDSWGETITTQGATVQKNSAKLTSNVLATAIQDDGCVWVNAYAPASDGTTASVVRIDFVDFQYTLVNNSNLLTIDYKGTYKSKPILEATMTSDNGVVAFINQSNGALLQFGNPSEVDQANISVNEWIVHDRNLTQANAIKAGWLQNSVEFVGKFLGKHNLKVTGALRYLNIMGTPHVGVSNWGTGSEYHGPTFSRIVSPDSEGEIGAKNFEFRFVPRFVSTATNQTGLWLIELRDTEGRQLCSVAYFKNSTTSDTATIRLNVNNQNWASGNRPFTYYHDGKNEIGVNKIGNRINFHIGGITNGGFIESRIDEAIRNRAVAEIVWYSGVFGTGYRPLEMSISSVTMRKMGVEKVIDVKNRFGEGDVLRVDTNTRVVTVNGLQLMDLGALGNDFDRFFLEKGENNIQCITSDWLAPENMPKFRAIYKENFL